MGSFASGDDNSKESLKPLRVPALKDGIYQAAKEMVGDLPGWELVSDDAERLILSCRRPGGVLSGTAEITITVEGPDGIPSTTVNVRSQTRGGLRSRDKQNVAEFMVPFHRRVC
jgi:hypothetical protein